MKRQNVFNYFIGIGALLVAQLSCAESPAFKVETLKQLDGVPWGIAQLDANRMIYTIRSGGIGLMRMDDKNKVSTLLQGAPEVLASGQGGMLDVAVPPKFKKGDWIYFTYSKSSIEGGVTVLSRAKLEGAELKDWQELLISESAAPGKVHFGSRIAFDGEGHVFFGVGDRGERDNAQDTSNHAGTIMRLKLDGSVPEDNPFVGVSGHLPEIYSIGHRNPQGLAFDRENKRLWEIEHGPRGGDEINLLQPGKNYGWPVISYGKEYWGPLSVGEGTAKAGMEQPVKQYTPSIAPGSLMLYSGKAFPQWQGRLFAGALKLRHLNMIELDESGKAIAETRLLESQKERIRALLQGLDGLIYFTTDSGKVMRLVPSKQ